MTKKAIVFDAYGTLYDTQAVSDVMNQVFPEHGEYITQVWRLKQLEYSWLRSLMGRYADFRAVTREALAYTLGTLGLAAEAAVFDGLVEGYNQLSPYPEAKQALEALDSYRRVILSNGSPDMLEALVRHSDMGSYLQAVISVDAKRVYKPDPQAYELVQERLDVRPEEVVFVTSNGFDVAGAKSFGFTVARIERVTQAALAQDLLGSPIGAASMYRALRTQTEAFSEAPDHVIHSLTALPGLMRTLVA